MLASTFWFRRCRIVVSIAVRSSSILRVGHWLPSSADFKRVLVAETAADSSRLILFAADSLAFRPFVLALALAFLLGHLAVVIVFDHDAEIIDRAGEQDYICAIKLCICYTLQSIGFPEPMLSEL